MKPETIQKLLTINRQFYQTFAADFDATRQRLQPGVERVLDLLPPRARILDLGCGNGELARELARRGFAGEYVGVDFSEGLVARCQVSGVEVSGGRYQFRVADLTAPDWDAGLDGPFDVVVAFAVLHHLPGPFHVEIMRKVRELLTFPLPVSYFLLSNWQFLNSPRWVARIQPWERVGLTAEDVAPNDYLLDWRRGGEGLRYVHHFTTPELTALAETTGFEVLETFASDGAEGNLGLYQIWKIP